MTQPQRRMPAKDARKIAEEGMGGWSAQEFRAEIAQTRMDLIAARRLESAARRRHEEEQMAETEAAYLGRRGEARRLQKTLDRLLEALNRSDGRRPDQTSHWAREINRQKGGEGRECDTESSPNGPPGAWKP